MTRALLDAYLDTNIDTNGVQGITGAELHTILQGLLDEAIIKGEAGDIGAGLEWDGTTLKLAVHSHAISDVTGLQTALDAKAPIINPTFTGTTLADHATVAINRNAGLLGSLVYQTAGVNRFIQWLTVDAESGANAGSNFQLLARADDGSNLGTVYEVERATRILSFGVTPKVGSDAVWHAGNDGAGSGLDADLLDAQSGAFYLDLGNATGTLDVARIADGTLTLAKMANLAQSTIIGRAAGAGIGVPTALTATQAKTLLAIAAGDVSGLSAFATSTDIANATGTLDIARIAANSITYDKLPDSAQSTLIGRAAGAGTGDTGALTATQVKTLLAIAAGDVSGLAAIATSGSASDLSSGTVPNARISGAYDGITTLGMSSHLTIGGLIIGSGTFIVRQGTADGGDDGSTFLAGGGGVATNRGAFVGVYGNEHASQGGKVRIVAGDAGFISLEGSFVADSTFDFTSAIDNPMIMTYVNAGGLVGPILDLFRDSSSPAVNDIKGRLLFTGKNGSGSKVEYSYIDTTILATTAGSESGRLRLSTIQAGAAGVRLLVSAGLHHSLATGGDKGDGTINMDAVYDDNVLLTCMALQPEFINGLVINKTAWDRKVPDQIIDGEVSEVPVFDLVEKSVERNTFDKSTKKFIRSQVIETVRVPRMMKAPVVDASGNSILDENGHPVMLEQQVVEVITKPGSVRKREHKMAALLSDLVAAGFDPRDPENFIRHMENTRSLPGMPTEVEWEQSKYPLGEMASRSWLAMECMALAFRGLTARVKKLEAGR